MSRLTTTVKYKVASCQGHSSTLVRRQPSKSAIQPERPQLPIRFDVPRYILVAAKPTSYAGCASGRSIATARGSLSCNNRSVAATIGSAWKRLWITEPVSKLQTASRIMPW